MPNNYPMLPLTLLVLACFGLPGHAAELYVIAHSDVNLKAYDLQDVFTGEKQFSGGIKLVPVDNSAARSEFLSKVLNLESKRYETLWVKKAFRDGIAIPALKNSDTEVIAYVKTTPGAVSYVLQASDQVKTLAKF